MLCWSLTTRVTERGKQEQMTSRMERDTGTRVEWKGWKWKQSEKRFRLASLLLTVFVVLTVSQAATGRQAKNILSLKVLRALQCPPSYSLFPLSHVILALSPCTMNPRLCRQHVIRSALPPFFCPPPCILSRLRQVGRERVHSCIFMSKGETGEKGNWRVDHSLDLQSHTHHTHTTHARTHTRTHRWKSVYNTHIALSREKNTHTKKTKTKSKQSIRTLSSPNMERGM